MADERLQACLKAWQAINLTALQPSLDAKGLEIVENQKDSLQTRKKLAEQTKEFKKIPDDAKIKEFKNLLKGYQSEIDAITRRSKTAENAFLDLYKMLAEAPDPALLLNAFSAYASQAGEVASMHQKNKQLSDELSHAQEQLTMLKKDEGGMVTLKSRLARYEAMLDEMVEQKVAEKEIEIKHAMDEKIRIYKETEYSLQRQVSQLKDQVTSLQTTHEVTQARLVDHSQKYDEEVAAKLGELEIVMVDLDRANLKIAQIERENNILRADLAEFRGENGDGAEWQDPVVMAKQIQSLETDLSRALENTDQQKNLSKALESDLQKRISEMERDLARKNLELAQYKTQLVMYDDYEEIKRELEVIKSIEFDGWEFKDAETTDGTQDSLENEGNTRKTLEQLLLSKNKKLEAELTSLRLELSTKSADLDSVSEELKQVTLEAEGHTKLIRRLEEDLSKVERFNGPSRSAAPTSPQRDGLSALVGGATLPPVVIPRQNTDNNEGSIVPILTSQRDRYRQRNIDLEEQLRSHVAMIADLRSELTRLKDDNAKLYERVRYAQTFKPGDGGGEDSYGSNRRGRGGPSHTALEMTGQQPDITTRYRAAYETSLDPFAQFHTSERARRVRDLNPADRAAFVFTRMILSHRGMRWGFVCYCVFLHLLVWWITFGGTLSKIEPGPAPLSPPGTAWKPTAI
ncbi:CASP C terminal-domain-containing protein [Phlyctochytrium arcticum]|nr:CASP C terminal-domain-containing protein [Phlyctochytrium arcticum]